MHNFLVKVTLGIAVLLMVAAAYGQDGQWAAADDPTANYMIETERQWAETACTHNGVVRKILADDFQGTAPDGKRYTKAEEVQDDSRPKAAHDCRLDDAKVRLFGDKVAIVYGSERSIRKGKDGKESTRCLVWTDTWLKRNGKWQIVAAQDTQVKCQ